MQPHPGLHPGIDESEVVRLLEGIGPSSTSEVGTWFGWHDGAGGPGMSSTVIELVPGGEFYALAHLCGEYITTRSIAVEIAAAPDMPFTAEERWPRSGVPR